MKGDNIPDGHTISRYCAKSKISEFGKPTGDAFRLRPSELNSPTPHVSVNWLECYNNKTRNEQIDEIRIVLSTKLKLDPKAKLVLLNVKAIHDEFRDGRYNIRILHWPDKTEKYDDPSHSGIFDVEKDPDVIADMLALVDSEVIPAKI